MSFECEQAKHDICVIIGDDFILRVQIFDQDTGQADDLTGYTVTSNIETGVNGDLIEAMVFNATESDLPNGIVHLDITAANTTPITNAVGVYDVKFVSPSGVVKHWVFGDVEFKTPVT